MYVCLVVFENAQAKDKIGYIVTTILRLYYENY